MKAKGKHLRQKLAAEEGDSLTVRGSKPAEEGSPPNHIVYPQNNGSAMNPLPDLIEDSSVSPSSIEAAEKHFIVKERPKTEKTIHRSNKLETTFFTASVLGTSKVMYSRPVLSA